MPSRQDQLHSYQFMVQRVVAALVLRETDPAQSPFRRAAGATLASVLIAVIALGGFAAYGVVMGGGASDWQDTSAVIVEKESGARYVYRDEKLHLVLNYASALLIVGSTPPKTVFVSRRSIEGVPRGTPLGIADAPDSLPAAGRLAGGPWTLCSAAIQDGGEPATRSVLLVGERPGGGQPLTDAAVLARHATAGLFLIWHNRRFPIADAKTVLSALGWAGQRPVAVAPALLNALEVGRRLELISIQDRGKVSATVPEAKIGQVFVVRTQGGGRQYAVALRDGLANVTQVQVDILLTDDRTAELIGQTEPTEMSQGRFAQVPKLPDLVPAGPTAPPASTPALTGVDGGAICGVVRDDAGVTEIRVGVAMPNVADAARTASRAAEGTVLADYVLVGPGRAVVVQSAAAPGAPGGTVCLVTDLGRRYAIANAQVLGMLGYADVKPVRLPAGVVALLPAGRALDPEAARAPAAPG